MSPDPSAPPVLLVTHVTAIDAGAVPDLLAGLGRRSRIIRANKGEPFPEDVESLGGVVSFGGPQSANDDHVDYVRAELDWVPRVMAAGVPHARHLPRKPDGGTHPRRHGGPRPERAL